MTSSQRWELTEENAEQRGVEAEQLEREEYWDEAGQQSSRNGSHVVDEDWVGPRSVGDEPCRQAS